MPTTRALLSVWDKTGLVEFARGLAGLGVELVSTGGTLAALEEAGLQVTAVAEVTGFPEVLDGRVKTLHPRIHGGILADRDAASHRAALDEHGIEPFDLVVVNLYPFREAAAGDLSAPRPAGGTGEDVDPKEVIEMIDIGGPTLVRAAAKNHRHVTVVVEPGDYGRVLEVLEAGDDEAIAALRGELAGKAFGHTAAYDMAIAGWIGGGGVVSGGEVPERLGLELERVLVPRYGENPHQAAGVYRTVGGSGIFGGFVQHQGKELSYNNLLDADAGRRLVAGFDRPPLEGPVVAILKHNNPCGVGCGATPAEAYERALACDPMSAFGSIVATNRPADGALAEAMAKLFVEVIVAPAFDEEALAIFARKKNLRVLECPVRIPVGQPSPTAGTADEGRIGREASPPSKAGGSAAGLELRGIDGGFLAQTPDTGPDDPSEWRCVTERRPSAEEKRALALAWRVVRQVRSNAIVVANARQTVGIGAGQMSRVDSCRIAIDKAQLPLEGTAAGSDAFFPFADGVEVLADAGVTAIVQPGGSKRDGEVVAAADERGVAMMMTGRRHFRH